MSTALRLDSDEIEIPPGEDELPYSFGPPMDSDIHRLNMNSLVDSGALHLAERPDVYVSGDMAIYFSARQTKVNDFLGPDVYVVTGTTKRLRKSWVVWEEARTPDIVIEITSPTTEAKDRGEKMRIYANALRVPEYYIYDPASGALNGFELAGMHYRPIAPTGEGEIRSTVLPVGLRVVPRAFGDEIVHWLRWTDADGALVPLPIERAETAEHRAAEAEAGAARAQAEAAGAMAEAAGAKAEAAGAKAEAAGAKAEAERLAALLRTLGVDPGRS